MVYIAKDAWPEKKDFLKENINCTLVTRELLTGYGTVDPTLDKQAT